MIISVMRKKEISRAAAIDYILAIGTGKLLAQARYNASVPEGKPNKGLLVFASDRARKRLAPKAKRLLPLAAEAAAAAAKRGYESSRKSKSKRKSTGKAKRKDSDKPAADPRQLEIAAAE